MPVAPPDPAIAEHRQQQLDRITAARQAGATWDQIDLSLNKQIDAARAAGATDEQIQKSLGFRDPEELIASMQGDAQQHMAATKPGSWVDALVDGLTHSSTAALLGIKPTNRGGAEGHPLLESLAETAGDVPAMLVGGAAGAVGGAVGGAGAGAVAGGGPEDVPADIAGAGAGAYFGAAAGANALPQLIKSERDRYVTALNSGQVKGPADFLRIQSDVLKDTGEAAAVGLATAGAGKVVSPVLNKMGMSGVSRFIATAGTEAATMATAQAALQKRMPTAEDFVDATVTVGAFHAAGKVSAPAARAIRARISQHYVQTGEMPQEAAQRAVADPVFRASMLGEPEPDVPPGSSHTVPAGNLTDSNHGHFVEQRRDEDGTIFLQYHPADGGEPMPVKIAIDNGVAQVAANQFGTDKNRLGPAEIRSAMGDLKTRFPQITRFEGWRKSGAGAGRVQQIDVPPAQPYIVPRVAGDFDSAVKWIMQEEGGLTTDTGGVTKYGISSKSHPGVDVTRLSQEDAANIYHREYWRAIDADALPPNMRLAAFDSAVNEGVGQTKVWLKQAGGDLQAFMKLRIEKYARLARDPKYAPYASGWANRLEHLGVSKDAAEVIRGGPDHTNEEISPEDLVKLDLDGSGREPPETSASGGEAEGGDPWEKVMGRVAPLEEEHWWGRTVEGAKRIYGELFDPSHPVRKLVDGATKGDTLDDAHNPEFLFRLAENSGEAAKWAISKEMIDLDGKVTGPALEDIVSGKSTGQKFSPAEQRRFLDGYALSKWAMMMEDQGKKTGVDAEAARAVVAEGDTKFGKSFEHLVDWRNGTLRWLGEIHGQTKIDKLVADNTASIPGYRRMEDGSYRPVSTGKPGIWNPVKEARGSERQVEPILKSLMQDAFLRHQLAWNNRAVGATADLGLKGNKAAQRRVVNFNVIGALDDLREKGIDEDILSSLAKGAGGILKNDEVPLFRDGKMYAVKFEDPELTRVLRGYDQNARSTLLKVIGAVTSVPRNFQTRFNPLFPVRLLAYDLPWQAIVNPDSKGPLSSFFVGLGHMTSDPGAYHEWLRSGGADHVFARTSNSAYMKRVFQGHEELSLSAGMWNVAKTPFDLLTTWTRMVSTPIKFGRYVRGLKQGETPTRAAVASSEAAFHRPGYGGPVGKAWNTLVPYTTAHLNGLEKSTRALLGLGRTITGVKYNAARTWGMGAALITLPVIAQWFAYKDQEWYKAMPDWQKNNAWFIVPPVDGSPPIPVAAPPIISAIFAAIPRMMLEGYYADNPHAFDHFWDAMGESLLPPGGLTAASVLTPVIEHYANFSFHRGRPLVSDSMVSGLQPAEQYTAYSSQASKAMAQALSDLPLIHPNLPPPVIDNYIANWGGAGGRALVNAAAAAVGKDPAAPMPETTVADWPGLASWTERYPSASAAPIEQFYDTITKAEQEHGSLVKTIRAGDFAQFKKIVDRGGPSAAAWQQFNMGWNVPPGVDLKPYQDYLMQVAQGADIGNLRLAHQAADALKLAHKYTVLLDEDTQKSAHDKRQLLDIVNAHMQQIAEQGNQALDRALVGVNRAGASANAPVPDQITFNLPNGEMP